MPLELAQLTATRIDQLPRSQTVFFFAVGPFEDHGPHLPVGLDLAEATRLSWLAAEKLEATMPGWVGVLMPAAPLGIDTETNGVVLSVRAHVLRDWLVDAARSLQRSGFRHFACFSGHLGPRQLTAIEEAGRTISRTGLFSALLARLSPASRATLVSASSALVTWTTVKSSPFVPDAREHGGARDTSVALALWPEAVSAAYQSLEPVARGGATPLRRQLTRALGAKGSVRGYWGDPRTASAERGRAELQAAIDDVFPRLRAVWEGSNPELVFKSWYSVLPPNKSFFKAWALALLFLAIMMAWFYVNFQALVI